MIDELARESPHVRGILDDIKWEILYFTRFYITGPIRSFMYGINNLIIWRKIIFRDRWWDYSYMLDIQLFKLKKLEEHWGKDTHYVGDFEDKDTLKKLIKDLEWMIEESNEFDEGYEKEYKKRARSFYGRLERNHRKFWD